MIAINAFSILWAVVGSLAIGSRFADAPNVVDGLPQLLTFLGVVAFPIHSLGMYAGWLMTKRSIDVRRLIGGTIISFLWAVDLWFNFTSDQVLLRIYKDQGYVQIMVFLLLACGFTLQTMGLAGGSWAAYRRKQETLAHTESNHESRVR